MKTSTTILTALAAALALSTAGAVLAHQGEGHGSRTGMGMGMGKHGEGHGRMQGGDRSAQQAERLAALKAELKISAAQEPAWQQYETVLRQQAEARKAMHDKMQAHRQAMAQDPKAASGADRSAQRESMREAMRQQHATQRAAGDQARQALLAVLTPEQKTLLAEQRLAGGRGHGHRGHMQRQPG